MDTTIKRETDGDRGAFFIEGPDEAARWLAELTYTLRGGVMVINHTGVREALQGQGVARRLVDAAVAAARAEGLKIQPVCSYARKVLHGSPDFEDVLA